MVPKISVIVPIYNAGGYLQKCLETLVFQTLEDIEIILVLDNPTDGSDLIAKQYAAKYDNVVILENTQNLHIGFARNEGLKIAKGEYIGFSDHDDFRELNMYEKLFQKAHDDDADVVISLPVEIRAGQKYICDWSDIANDFTKKRILSDLVGFGNNDHPQGALFVNIHNIIYRRQLLFEHNITFVDTKKISPEDVLFQIKSIYFSRKTVLVPEGFYYHLSNENSEGTKYSYISYAKRAEGLNAIYRFLLKENLFEHYKSFFYNGVCRQFIYCLSSALLNPCLGEFLKARKQLRSYDFTKEAFSNYNLVQVNKKVLNRVFRQFLILMLK